LVAVLLGTTAVVAQEEDQPPGDSPPLTLFTRYPAQEAAIGEDVRFDLTLRSSTSSQIVRLGVENLPEGWTATFRGGGEVVRAAYVEPESETSVDLRIEPPQDVKADTYSFAAVATGEVDRARLPIELVIKEKLPPSLSLRAELPTLRGTSDTTFRYDVTLENNGDQDLSVNLIADAPSAFQVTFKLAGQEVTSIPLDASGSKRLDIEARALGSLSAGSYQVDVLAQGGEAQARITLTAEVTGKAELRVTTPDGRLSGKARAGAETPFKFLVTNNGSAPARNVEMSASPPSGWSVEFSPEQIDQIPSGQQVEVNANIKPAEQAVAGDYMATVRARTEEGSSESVEFRVTVLTSTLWGVVGVAVIAVAVLVVVLAVMRFGRR
jgi:uncharacterized membrane protein